MKSTLKSALGTCSLIPRPHTSQWLPAHNAEPLSEQELRISGVIQGLPYLPNHERDGEGGGEVLPVGVCDGSERRDGEHRHPVVLAAPHQPRRRHHAHRRHVPAARVGRASFRLPVADLQHPTQQAGCQSGGSGACVQRLSHGHGSSGRVVTGQRCHRCDGQAATAARLRKHGTLDNRGFEGLWSTHWLG